MLGREDRPTTLNGGPIDVPSGTPPAVAPEDDKPDPNVDEALCAAFSPDGRRVAAGAADGTIYVADTSRIGISAALSPVRSGP